MASSAEHPRSKEEKVKLDEALRNYEAKKSLRNNEARQGARHVGHEKEVIDANDKASWDFESEELSSSNDLASSVSRNSRKGEGRAPRESEEEKRRLSSEGKNSEKSSSPSDSPRKPDLGEKMPAQVPEALEFIAPKENRLSTFQHEASSIEKKGQSPRISLRKSPTLKAEDQPIASAGSSLAEKGVKSIDMRSRSQDLQSHKLIDDEEAKHESLTEKDNYPERPKAVT